MDCRGGCFPHPPRVLTIEGAYATSTRPFTVTYIRQLKASTFAPIPLQLCLYGSLRYSRKLTLRAQTIRLFNAPFRLEPQRFGESRSLLDTFNCRFQVELSRGRKMQLA